MIRILLADDHGIVRSGMRSTLKDANDMKIIAEAKTGEEAVTLAQQLKPDIILMDINMPGTDGFSASLQLLQSGLAVKVLIISGQPDSMIQRRLLQMGISGYLTKNTSPEILKKAIRAVYAGEQYFDIPAAIMPADSPFNLLSDRELQIALMVARGMTTKEIAQHLFLSNKTVNGYHRDLLKKLDVKKDVELTRLALQYQLIDLENV